MVRGFGDEVGLVKGRRTNSGVRQGHAVPWHCSFCGRVVTVKCEHWREGRVKSRPVDGVNVQRLKASLRKAGSGQCNGCGRVFRSGLLELDHVDGDPSNDDLTNLQFLCKGRGGCHSRKTVSQRQGSVQGDAVLKVLGVLE